MYVGRAGEKYKTCTTHDVHILNVNYNGNNEALNVTIVSTSLLLAKMFSDTISQHLFFKNFLGGEGVECPQTP